MKTKPFVEDILEKGQEIVEKACILENEILMITNSKI